MPDYHLFLSYCREDNKQPVNEAGEGWVTAFEREIKERHRRYSGRELKIFSDQKAIDTARDWRRELGAGLRSSRLFLAFLTPNYLTSPNCLWEWDEYLRREHSAARGDDGLTPIYFVSPAANENEFATLALQTESRLLGETANWQARRAFTGVA